jgi:hypothetical protein
MDIDIPMLDVFDHQGSETLRTIDGAFANYVENNILNSESNFAFPTIQATVQDAPAYIHPDRVVLLKAAPASSASQDARARQETGSANPFEHSRQQRDFGRSNVEERSSPPRRCRRSRSRSPEQPLYPDYYTPKYSRRDRHRDHSDSSRVAEPSQGAFGERKLSTLVFSMTDMDVGRDDRYRGSGYRGGGGGGGNKRRRDGKLQAG